MRKKILNIIFLIFRIKRHNSKNEFNRMKGSPTNFIVLGRRSMVLRGGAVTASERLRTAGLEE